MQRVPFAEVDARPYFDWWRERFAPEPEPFAGLRCYQRGKSNIWIGAVDIAGLATTRTDAVGVPLLRVGRRMWKPTSVAIVTFGSDSQGNVLDVDRDEARAFLDGTPLELPADDRRWADVSPGFLVVRHAGVALGCGEWREAAILSCIPKGKRISEIDVYTPGG